MIRKAVDDDLYPIIEMARRFVDETNLSYTFSEEITKQTLWEGINNEEAIFLVDDQDGVIAGAIMGYTGRDFCDEYSAYITKFYIEKEFRGLKASMNLIKAFESETKGMLVFTSATAGISEKVEKMYVNLFKHAGYSVLGRVLVKENP